MKVLCIDNGFNNILPVTIGKWYEIVPSPLLPRVPNRWESSGLKSLSYFIICDTGKRVRLSKKYFITQEELREKKFQELGI